MTRTDDRILMLDGPVTMATAGSLVEDGRSRARDGNLVVDFSSVDECDSAALALLFEWQRTAQASGHVVELKGMPDGLASLAELYGVSELLPAGASAAGF